MHSKREITVVTQNVLHDVPRTESGLILPQDHRIESMVATLAAFEGSLDVVAIQEAHKSTSKETYETKQRHNGEWLAESLGFGSGYWIGHNSKRAYKKAHPQEKPKGREGEYMGMFGSLVEEVDEIDIGDNRKALMTVIGTVAVVNVHFRSGSKARDIRRDHVPPILERVEEYPNVIWLGDFNEPDVPFYAKARKEIERNGFTSVLNEIPLLEPKDALCPIPLYKDAGVDGRKFWEKPFVRRGWQIDDILIRGQIAVKATGVLKPITVIPELSEEDSIRFAKAPLQSSDHPGLWATLEIPYAA